MQQTLCDKYGFDKAGRERRLALLGFGVEDIDLAQQLQTKVLAPNQHAIIEALYEFITHKPDMTTYIDKSETLEALKQSYHNYLSSLGVDYSSFEYFENRLHIGVTHARNGFQVLYFGAVIDFNCQ